MRYLSDKKSGRWTGTGHTQPRVVKIEGDLLHLSTASPIVSGGKSVNAFLTWKKVDVQ